MADTQETHVDQQPASLEEQLRVVVDHIPALVWSKLPDGSLDFFNLRFQEYTGLSLEDGLGWGWIKVFHPDDRAMDEWRAALAAGKPFQREARIRGVDGTYRWFELRAVPVKNHLGEITNWFATSTDIDDRKRAEAELRQLIDIVPQYMCVDKPNGDVIYANDRLLDFLGLKLEEVQSSDFRTRVFHPDDLDRVRKSREEAVSKGLPWEVETRIRRKDGQYRWFLIRFNPLRDADGNVIRWYAAGTDIENQKQADEELRQLVDAIATHVVVLDGEGRRLYANRAVLDYHGYTQQQFLTVDHRECFHPEDLPPYEALRQSAIANGKPWEAEIRLRRKDGEYRWFLMRSNPLRDADGRVIRWYLARTDIEDRKQAEQSLRTSEAYLAEAQRLSHTGSFAHGVKGEMIYLSEEAYRTFGFDPATGQLSYEQVRGRVHPDDFEIFDACSLRTIQRKTESISDFRLLLPNGSLKHIHCVSRPVFDASGEVVEVVGTNMDVTEQHEANAALEQAFQEIKQLKDALYRENLALKEEIDHASMFEEIVGTSEALRKVLVQVSKVAPADSTVLITGETGTGKELVARAIHRRSHRAERAFVSVNCAAIPPTLIGSELFGHEKGAFTGATQRRLGRFELADGGTLFLDEVGDLPGETQIALLRVLQERQFERVGGTQSVAVDVRIIAATNRALKAAVASGTFRSDLFYRLNVFPISVPPLRERKDDLPLLVEYLIERYASKTGKKIRNIQKKTLELFQSYDWPGNIRELQNVVERAVILCDGDTFSVDESWLQADSPKERLARNGLARLGSDEERALIENALAESRGQIAGPSGAAAKLGIPRSTLETKIRRLGIAKHRFKSA